MNTRRNFFLKSAALALSPVLAKASPISTPAPVKTYGRGMTRFWAPIDESPFISTDNLVVNDISIKRHSTMIHNDFCWLYEIPLKPLANV